MKTHVFVIIECLLIIICQQVVTLLLPFNVFLNFLNEVLCSEYHSVSIETCYIQINFDIKKKKNMDMPLVFFFIFLRERERLVFVGYAHSCPLLQLVRICYFYIWKLLHFSNIITEHRDNVNFYLILIKVLRVFKVHGWRG